MVQQIVIVNMHFAFLVKNSFSYVAQKKQFLTSQSLTKAATSAAFGISEHRVTEKHIVTSHAASRVL